MKNLNFLYLMTAGVVFLSACTKEDDDDNTPMKTDYGYQIQIEEPTTDDKMMGQTLHMEANFASLTGQAVHNVKVKLYKKTDKTVVLYEGPTPTTVNEADGLYNFHEHIDLTTDNGFTEHTDYIFETSVWGPTTADGLVQKKVEFHVHPM